MYYSTFNTLNYNEAKIYCNNRGFQLPVLDTKEKLDSLFYLTSNAVWVNLFLGGKSFLRNKFLNRIFFLQKVFSTSSIPKVFKWPNGDLIDSTLWLDDKPDNYLGDDNFNNENCVQMFYEPKLDDLPCDILGNVACEEV